LTHRLLATGTSERIEGWLGGRDGRVTLGVTAGASTPDSVVAKSIERLLAARGAVAADLGPVPVA